MMTRKRIIKYTAILFSLLAIINILSMKFFWYQAIWWFDMPMHFVGGFTTLLLLTYFFYEKIQFDFLFYRKIILLIFGAILVGLLWEVFEYIFNNIIAGVPWDIVDTSADIFWDTTGAICALVFMRYW
ncbi:MAG: hypothetical protein WC089_02035 [Candidatus Paceibacterota bacterium]